MSDTRYYHRGREARMRGQQRIIRDGRMSIESRKAWYVGWDEEDRQRQPVPSDAEKTECNEALSGIRQFLESSGYKPRTEAAL